MFEYRISCKFCNKHNRIQNIDLTGKYTCGFCQNSLDLSEFEEVLYPADTIFLEGNSHSSTPKSEASGEYGCCGCWLVLFGLIFFSLYPQSQPLSTKKETLERRLGETSKPVGNPITEPLQDKSTELQVLEMMIEEFRNKKGYKKLSEKDKSALWIEVYELAKTHKVPKDEFWKSFGDLIATDFVIPKGRTGNRNFLNNALCPLTIKTAFGSEYYMVKLEELTTKETVFLFFKGGSSFSTKVPPGLYTFKYAYGEKWYGWVFRFGPESNLFESEQSLSFYVEELEGGRNFVGHTIELIKQRAGNFKTKPISDDAF